MGNLVRAQWFRLLHGSSSGPFALTLVAVAGFVVVQFTAYWDDCGTFRAVLGRASVVEVYCVFVALYLAAFFAEDFQYGTVRNLMVGKGSRRAWALSALVVTFGCALGAMLLGAVVTGVVYGLMGGAPVAFDIGELAAWWLVASLLATAFSVVAVAVTVVVPWAPLTTAVVAATLLTSGLGYWFCQAAAVGLPAPLASFVTEGVLPLTLTALRLSLLNGAPIEPWWFADLALVLVASVIIIAAALNRKELRQS